MRIDNTGRLGVGLTSPAYAVDVSGDVNVSGAFRVGGVAIGTGAVSSVFTRTGAVVAVTGDYTAAQVTNAVDQTGSYTNPAWITSLPWSKITGAPATGVSSVFTRTGAVVAATGDYTAAQVTNAVDQTGSYTNPAWIVSIPYSKVSGAPSSGQISAIQTPWLSNISGGGFQLQAAGNIGIGAQATSPDAPLTINLNAAALPAAATTPLVHIAGADATGYDVLYDAFNSTPSITARVSGGTNASKSAVTNGLALLSIRALGYGATGYSVGGRARIQFVATQAWTDTAQGAAIGFTTTVNGTATTAETMRLDNSGNLGLNTTAPDCLLTINQNTGGSTLPTAPNPSPQTNIHVIGQDGQGAEVCWDTFGTTGATFTGRAASGTNASKSALTAGHGMFSIRALGYGATGYSSSARAQIYLQAGQNWTDTAQGTFIAFFTTPNGSTTQAEVARFDPNGRLGIANTGPSYPLDVTGDINCTGVFRVGGTPVINERTIRSVSTTQTILATDYTVVCTAASITITLPTAPPTGTILNVKNGNASGTVTVSAPVNIDAATSQTVSASANLKVQYDGAQWRIL